VLIKTRKEKEILSLENTKIIISDILILINYHG